VHSVLGLSTRPFGFEPAIMETEMYENQTNPTAEHAARTPIVGDATRTGDTTTRRTTDPKFVRESFTMRKMLPWQIAALAIAVAVVVGLAVFYF
jgi:hypothetical protein